jgi:hypothetical protein
MTEQRVLVLLPITAPTEVPGAVTVAADCGHQCWISPTGLTGLLGLSMRTVCQDCVPAGPKQISLLPGQRDELAGVLGTELAKAVITATMRAAENGELQL